MKLNLIFALFIIIMMSCKQKASVFTMVVEKIEPASFEKVIKGKQVSLYTLVNENGMGMKVTNYGARIVALCVPDDKGKPVDVVLGYNNLDDYVNQPEAFFGTAVGRYGNRIANAQFSLNDTIYQLGINNDPNNLHGGANGYHTTIWNAEKVNNSKIVFSHLSPDGDEGFPGNLEIEMSYELTAENELKIKYKALTDKATICNLTHHSYFNLSGEGEETMTDHLMMINADKYTPINETSIPFGGLVSVKGTPFDFTSPKVIGEQLKMEHNQLKMGKGYDHNMVINSVGLRLAATVISPKTKIKMDVITDQPGVQFYGGNFLNGTLIGKKGKTYPYRSAFCLETQHFPNSPNEPDYPTTTLLPGETYRHTCIYKFSIDK